MAIAAEITAFPLLISFFLGWRITVLAVVTVVAVLILSDIFFLKLKPSGKEPLGAFTFPLIRAFLLSTVVAVVVAVLFYKVVAAG